VPRWVQDHYYQAFTGEAEFQWEFPCNPTSLTKFRKGMGNDGFEKILSVSVAMHREKIAEDEMCIDTTVHDCIDAEDRATQEAKAEEKNIAFPTDAKQYQKIHYHLLKIARAEHIARTRTYEKEVKRIKLCTRFAAHPKNRKRARSAVKRLKTISGRLFREILRKTALEITNLRCDMAPT